MIRGFIFWLALLIAWPAMAQDAGPADPAVLVADSVRVEGADLLVAEGAVEVLYGKARLRAKRISYRKSTGELVIEGPITLTDGQNNLILADAAKLDQKLRNGILTSARIVLDEQLQIATENVQRVDGRYTVGNRVVTSSCQVCKQNPVPLWSIRARRVIHDQTERQLYFENATFRIMNVPVLWLPELRLPGPTLKRATGFLIPTLRTTSLLGTGVKIPYFIAMGQSRDLLVTPYLAAKTRTVELRYREAFNAGTIEFNGAASRDSTLSKNRGYLFGQGEFQLPQGFRLEFNIELTSDPAYLLDYDYSSKDRLQTYVKVERIRRDERIGIEAINFRTLRDSEIPIEDQLPYLIGQAEYIRRFPGLYGGEGQLDFSATAYSRTSNQDILGRDATVLGVTAAWQRDWITSAGIEAMVQGQMDAQSYFINQDSNYDPHISRITPMVGLTLRWPFERTGPKARQLLEPLVQVAWSDRIGGEVPNEDSMLVEFDQGNLLSLNHFPGQDRIETGLRAALGVAWTRYDPAGWSMGVTLGRVFRRTAARDFTRASGLAGLESDFLAAAELQIGSGLELTTRNQIADRLSITKSETRLTWVTPRIDLSTGYVFILPEAAEGRPDRTNELTVDTAYDFTDRWGASAGMRYDFDSNRAASAALGLTFHNECIAVDLSLSRRFTSSTSVTPTTDVGLKVSLSGFGNTGQTYRATCAR